MSDRGSPGPFLHPPPHHSPSPGPAASSTSSSPSFPRTLADPTGPGVFKSPAPKIPLLAPLTASSSSSVPAPPTPQQLLEHFNLLNERIKSQMPNRASPSIELFESRSDSSPTPLSKSTSAAASASPSRTGPLAPASSPSLSGAQIAALAAAAAAAPYKPFQTMTDPNFIQLLIAFSKASPDSRARYLDDENDAEDSNTTEHTHTPSSPTSIDRKVQKRLIQWGLAQRGSASSAVSLAKSPASRELRDRFQVPVAKPRSSSRLRVGTLGVSPQSLRRPDSSRHIQSPGSGSQSQYHSPSPALHAPPSSASPLALSPGRRSRRQEEMKSPQISLPNSASPPVFSPVSSARSPSQTGSPPELLISPSGSRKRLRSAEGDADSSAPTSGRSSPIEPFLSPRRSPRLSPAGRDRVRLVEKKA